MALIDNLVSYWKFDESSGNATDSNSTNTLTNNNTATFGAAALNNGATGLTYSGTPGAGKFFSITDASQSGLDITGDLSISVWVKPTANPGNGAARTVFGKSNVISSEAYLLYYTYNGTNYQMNIRIGSGSSGTDKRVNLGAALSTSSWSHLVMVYTASSGTFEIYVNGSSQGTNNGLPTSIGNSSAAFVIGGYYFSGAGPYDGWDGGEDEFGIWSKALTSSEVTELYNSGTPLAYPFSSTSQIKTWDAVTQANVKNFLGATNAQTKSWVGVTNV